MRNWAAPYVPVCDTPLPASRTVPSNAKCKGEGFNHFNKFLYVGTAMNAGNTEMNKAPGMTPRNL